MTYRPVPYIIEDVFDKMKANVVLPDGITVYFDYGTTNEITNTLKEKTNSPSKYNQKFPLLWLMMDDSLHEKIDNTETNPREPQNLTIVICTETLQEYKASERYANTIVPILRPIYESFMYYLKLSKEIRHIEKYNHDYYENLFWGRNGLYGNVGNIFDDRVDAVIIDNLKFKVAENCNV